MKPTAHVSPKQAARALDVSESTVKRWCDRGTLETVRTAGGHRRIPAASLLAWSQSSSYDLVHPEILGLPSGTRRGDGLAQGSERLQLALQSGDESGARDVAIGLFVAGHTTTEIFDHAFGPAFRRIGAAWESGEVEVYQERRACEITSRILAELRRLLPEPAATAPGAVGGTPSGDPYGLANRMVEISLREVGWAAQSLGSNLPGATLAAAVSEHRPRLVWLSVSHIDAAEAFLADYGTLTAAAERAGAAVAVGGGALDQELRSRMRFDFYGDTLAHLLGFAASLWRTAEASA